MQKWTRKEREFFFFGGGVLMRSVNNLPHSGNPVVHSGAFTVNSHTVTFL